MSAEVKNGKSAVKTGGGELSLKCMFTIKFGRKIAIFLMYNVITGLNAKFVL